MTKKNLQTLKGFRDFLPEKALQREEVFQKIRTVFQKYGFLPLETPVLEYKEILTGKYGDEGEKLMYTFKDRGERDVAMRYDLTVPLARVVAQYQNDLAMPFKRYQIAPVWRADNTQKGRYREFYQCDVDVVGSDSIMADAEVIACINEALKSLGIEDIVIRINNRKLLNEKMFKAGISPKIFNGTLTSIDKWDKIGRDGVEKELSEQGMDKLQRYKILEFTEADFEIPELENYLRNFGVTNYQMVGNLARGLNYYTGTIFEFVLPDAPQYGSIAGGGRYDELIGMFMTPLPQSLPTRGREVKSGIPAVGGSIGIDRLLSALEELELIKYDLVSDVLVCNLDEALEGKYLEIVRNLRDAGIKTDFYYESSKLEKQLKYADKKNINWAVIVGSNEAKKSEAAIKSLATGKQKTVKQKDLVQTLKVA